MLVRIMEVIEDKSSPVQQQTGVIQIELGPSARSR
jgi:hypothetical protein